MNRANFHQFKGSDWQTVAVRPTTIKADLYSLALSPIAISDVTVWSSLQRNFAELHLVLKGLDVEWKTRFEEGKGTHTCAHTHKTHLWDQSSLWCTSGLIAVTPKNRTRLDKRKQFKSHAIMFIISISGLIEMFQNQKITMPSFWDIESNGFVSALSADNCPSDVKNCVKWYTVKCAADT